MNTKLSSETELTIIQCAHRFDGYAYTKERLGTKAAVSDSEHTHLLQQLKHLQENGRLYTNPLDNMAVNFYLHRCFYHQGELPAAFSAHWFDMVFLYLHLYRMPTPSIHQHSDAHEWDQRPKGAAERAAAEIRLLLQRRG